MMRTLTLLLFTVSVQAAVTCSSGTWNGTTCNGGSRPLSYTVSGTAGVGDKAEAQAVLDDAQCGDTIMFEAGTTWDISSEHLKVEGKVCTASTPLTLTTTEYAKLPVSGTRVTPAYGPLMPYFRVNTSNKATIAISGPPVASTYVIVRGLKFGINPATVATTSHTRGPLLIGSAQSSTGVDDFGTAATSTADLPDNITVQHCYFTNETFRHAVLRLISLHGRRATIRDSFIEGGLGYGGQDSQGIMGYNGVGPYTIENNYVQGHSENIIFGGAKPFADHWVGSEGGTTYIRYNYLPKIQERDRVNEWEPNTLVFKGKHVWYVGATSAARQFYVATNTGCTGPTEPVWPTVTGTTVTEASAGADCSCGYLDCRVTWLRHYAGDGGQPQTKNNFESKSAQNLVIQYNVMEGMYNASIAILAGQESGMNIKAESQPQGCTGEWPDCHRSITTDHWIQDNIIRVKNGTTMKLVGGTNGTIREFGRMYVTNNQLEQQEDTTKQIFYLSPGNSGWDAFKVENNTFYATNYNQTRAFEYGFGAPPPGITNGVFRFNILPNGLESFRGSGTSEGNNTLVNMLGCDTSCGSTQWDKNVIVGGGTSVFPANSILTNCSGTAKCAEDWDYNHPTYGVLFKNRSTGDLRVRNTHSWARAASGYGTDLGVDRSQLPEIRGLTVTPTDRAVLVSWHVSAPIRDTPCVIEVNTAPDFASGTHAGEQSQIGTYYRQDADDADRNVRRGLKRMAVVGHTVNLTAGTNYWGRLQCAGDTKHFSFTTLPTLSGTGTLPVRRSGASAMTWGYGYSRATDAITDESAGSCASGVCTATVNKGPVIYYRIDSGPVQTTVVTQ